MSPIESLTKDILCTEKIAMKVWRFGEWKWKMEVSSLIEQYEEMVYVNFELEIIFLLIARI